MRRILLAVLAAAAVCTSVALAGPARAKSFSLPEVRVEAALLPNGDMRVVEHITYDFDGSFSNGTRPIPPSPDYEITDVAVAENGTPLPSFGAPYDLRWTFAAEDERRTFDVSYVVRRAVRMGADVGELYWKWLGPEHPGVGHFEAVLTVPGTGEGTLVWGHGPLSGDVRREGPVVWWRADGVPGGSFVEGRVAVPVGAFTAAVPGTEPRLPVILAEEQALADEANRRREAAADRRRLAEALGPVVPFLGWIVFLLIWLRHGREHRVEVAEYVREPLDDPPAVVVALRSFGTVKPLAVGATLVDLAQRGFLTIEEERTDRILLPDRVDHRFRRTDRPVTEVDHPWEKRLLDAVFEDGDETTQSEFVAWGRKHQEQAKDLWDDVEKAVKRELRRRRYIETGKLGWMALNVVTALAVGAAGIACIANLAPLPGVFCLASALPQLAATGTLRRRTPEGARRAAEWESFKRFLEDFSQMGDAPVGHLALWDRYLVYAVALDVSDEVAEQLAMRVPQPAGADGGRSWYVSSGSGVGRGSGFGRLGGFAAGFGAATHAVGNPTSGSGGGGGFSGGGGGGGGGGGIGAS